MRLRYKVTIITCTFTLIFALGSPVMLAMIYFIYPDHLGFLAILLIFMFAINAFTFTSMLVSTWRDESKLADTIFPLKVDAV